MLIHQSIISKSIVFARTSTFTSDVNLTQRKFFFSNHLLHFTIVPKIVTMESTPVRVDLINSVVSLAETLPQLLHSLSGWNLLQKDSSEAIGNFRTDLEYVQNCLTPIKTHISELGKHFGERLDFKKLSIDTGHCSDKLKQLNSQLNKIHISTQKKCMCFPSTRINRLEDLRYLQTTLITNIHSLIESINSMKQ